MTEENNQILEAELLEESSEISEPELLKVDIPNFGLVNIPKELIEKYRIFEGTKTPFTGFDIVKHIESKEIAPETIRDHENELGIIETLHRKEETPKPEIQGEKGSDLKKAKAAEKAKPKKKATAKKLRILDDFSNIFKRYDLDLEVTGQAREVSSDASMQKIAQFVVDGDDEGIVPAVKDALKDKSPLDIINDALIAGMNEVSRLWDEAVYFLPQVILSSDAMNAGIAECEAAMGKAMEMKAPVVTHTAEGDIHDIGQVIVNALLNANGFKVINLGADVPVDKVVSACKEHKPIMVTGTALMTTTMTAFPKIAHQLKAAGINIPFICGGGAVCEEYVTGYDLGIWGKEASQARGMAEDALAGESWEAMRATWNG